MSPLDTFLTKFIHEIREWSVRIKKATYAEEVTFTRSPDGVLVSVKWRTRQGHAQEMQKTFTPDDLLGRTRHQHPHAWTLQRKKCAYARDVIREALAKRGI